MVGWRLEHISTAAFYYHLPLWLIISGLRGNEPAAAVERNGLLDPGVGEKYFCREVCKSKITSSLMSQNGSCQHVTESG